MAKKIIFGILVLGVFVISVNFLIPVSVEKEGDAINQPAAQFLPWHIEPTAQGSIRVFGLTLGESTL